MGHPEMGCPIHFVAKIKLPENIGFPHRFSISDPKMGQMVLAYPYAIPRWNVFKSGC